MLPASKNQHWTNEDSTYLAGWCRYNSLCVWEVSDSNLGMDTGNPNGGGKGRGVVSIQSYQANARNVASHAMTALIKKNQFIIQHYPVFAAVRIARDGIVICRSKTGSVRIM
jgi:hypothetical protein